jgi:nuclear GTP-binding protein
LTGASRIVLRDWNTGKFPRYTTPATKNSTSSNMVDYIERLYGDELSILATSSPRKEMWKRSGLVKLVPGDLEARKAVLDEQWLMLDEEQEDGGVSDSAEKDSIEICNHGECDRSLDGDGDEEGDEEEAEDASDSDEEEGPRKPLPVFTKVKRKREIEHTFRPIKKVAFASASEGHSQVAGSLNQTISTKPTIQTRNPAFEKGRKVATKTKPVQSAHDEAYDFSNFF